jgi:hypothetical protein
VDIIVENVGLMDFFLSAFVLQTNIRAGMAGLP